VILRRFRHFMAQKCRVFNCSARSHSKSRYVIHPVLVPRTPTTLCSVLQKTNSTSPDIKLPSYYGSLQQLNTGLQSSTHLDYVYIFITRESRLIMRSVVCLSLSVCLSVRVCMCSVRALTAESLDHTGIRLKNI